MVSDPGYHLVEMAQTRGIKTVPVPGPCALVCGLSVSGLPAGRFVFEGFLPPGSPARRQRLESLRYEPRTLVVYEAPHRIVDLLVDMCDMLGPQRRATIARELTKTYETILNGTLEDLATCVSADPDQSKGELVVMVAGAGDTKDDSAKVEGVLRVLLEELPTRQAVRLAVGLTGERRNKVYRMAMELSEKK